MTLVIAPGVEDTNQTTAKPTHGSKPKPIQGDTILVYIIDRSGSMSSCWEPTIGGLNEDLRVQQKDDDGKTEAVFYFFDSSWQQNQSTRIVKPFEGPLNEAVQLDQNDTAYGPSGGTPLYDAVGQVIREVQDRVAATDGGANVIVSIFTDGRNNNYHGFSADQVKAMVEECEGQGWTFTYFGANQDAWAVGGSFGIKAGNTMSYDTSNMSQTMATASVARSAHTQMAKAAFAAGETYNTATYFADVGQSEDDYKM